MSTDRGSTAEVASASAPIAAACGRCGRDADFDFGHLWLCLDCYHIAGSTCAGLGRSAAPDARDAGRATSPGTTPQDPGTVC